MTGDVMTDARLVELWVEAGEIPADQSTRQGAVRVIQRLQERNETLWQTIDVLTGLATAEPVEDTVNAWGTPL